jgi:hypothetical protein
MRLRSNKDRIIFHSDAAPSIPESFVRSLREYDPTLHIQWNKLRKRFVIVKCAKHFSPTPEHNHACQNEYVCLAQTDEGEMLPLGDRVMDIIRARDVTRLGYGPGDAEKFCKVAADADEQNRKRIERAQVSAMKYAGRHNRRQLAKAARLMMQEGVTVSVRGR